MPGFHHAMTRPFRGDGQPVELARQADGEIADIDHLLNFAAPFLENLSVLQGDETTQNILRCAQLLAEQADKLAPPRRGAGIVRQVLKAVVACAILASISACESDRTRPRRHPSIGEWTSMSPASTNAGETPRAVSSDAMSDMSQP